MLLRNAPRPQASEVAFKRFRLARTDKRCALAFLQQLIELAKRFLVIFLPVTVLLKRFS